MVRKLVEWSDGIRLTSPLSAGWEVDGLVILSGQVPLDPKSGGLVGSDFTSQVNQVFDNLIASLAVAELTMADVIRCTCYLTDRAYFGEFNKIYSERFTKPYPARTTLIVGLANADYLVEIDAIATRR